MLFMVLGMLLFLLDIAFRRFTVLLLTLEGMGFSMGNVKKIAVKEKKKPLENEVKNKVSEQIPIKAKADKKEILEKATKENTAAKLVASKKKRGI